MRVVVFLVFLSSIVTASSASATTVCTEPLPTTCILGVDCPSNCQTDQLYPLCSDLGCPLAPSGSPYVWTPCTTRLCYCSNPPVTCAQY